MRAQSLRSLATCAVVWAGSAVFSEQKSTTESALSALSLPAFEPPILKSSTVQPSVLKHGQISELVKPKTHFAPIVNTPHDIFFVGNPASSSQVTSVIAQQFADRIEDSLAFVFVSDHPFNFAPRLDEDKNAEGPYVPVALTLSEAINQNIKESGKSVFIVSAGAGSLAVIGAIERAHRELLQADPLRAKEMFANLHLVIAGSFDLPEQFTSTSKELGSIFKINVLDSRGERVDGLTISDAVITQHLIPCITQEMFQKSGTADVKLPMDLDKPALDERLDRKVAEAITQARLSRAQDQLRRAIQEIQHLANQKKIDVQLSVLANALEKLRMLTYKCDELGSKYDQVINDLKAVLREQRAIEGVIDKIAKNNTINQELLFDLKENIREGVSEIIRNILSHPRDPASASIRFNVPTKAAAAKRVHPTGVTTEQIAADFDRDGVPDIVETQILEHFRPVLANNAAGNRVPISVTRFLDGSELVGKNDDLNSYLRVKDLNMPTPESDAIWYGHVIQPLDQSDGASHRYIVQYYALYPVNTVTSSETWTTVVNVLDGVIGPLAGVRPTISVERGYVGPLGGHEGDWNCVDFLVEVPSITDLSSAKIIHGVFHNHGRQFFMEGSGIVREQGRPVVFSEVGTQELHPRPGPAHENGFSREATSNEVKDGVFDSEGYVIAEHFGRYKLFDIPVFNVGEVECSQTGLPVASDNQTSSKEQRTLHQVDGRVFNGKINQQHQAESKFLLEYPGQWGSSKYDLAIRLEIPFTGWGHTISLKSFGSPRGPVFNSAAGSVDDKPYEIDSKMWTRRFNFDGGNLHDDAVIASPAKKTTDASGVTLSWPEIPYALGYLVTVRDSRGKEFLYIPGWDREIELRLQGNNQADYSKFTHFRHDKGSGRRPDREYTYKVAVIWSRGVREFKIN